MKFLCCQGTIGAWHQLSQLSAPIVIRGSDAAAADEQTKKNALERPIGPDEIRSPRQSHRVLIQIHVLAQRHDDIDAIVLLAAVPNREEITRRKRQVTRRLLDLASHHWS